MTLIVFSLNYTKDLISTMLIKPKKLTQGLSKRYGAYKITDINLINPGEKILFYTSNANKVLKGVAKNNKKAKIKVDFYSATLISFITKEHIEKYKTIKSPYHQSKEDIQPGDLYIRLDNGFKSKVKNISMTKGEEIVIPRSIFFATSLTN